jgi:hypothetical protein
LVWDRYRTLIAPGPPPLRDRRAGYDTESDLLGVATISAVLVVMPLLDRWADRLVGLRRRPRLPDRRGATRAALARVP